MMTVLSMHTHVTIHSFSLNFWFTSSVSSLLSV